MSAISMDKVKEVCKIGQGADCCKYLMMGTIGFECGKLGVFRKYIDERTDMSAKGDNCDGQASPSSTPLDIWWGQYPSIRVAALLIAYDNGMVNRGETEKDFLERAHGALTADGVVTMDLVYLEMFLKGLSEADIMLLCCGEQSDQDAIEVNAPFSRGEPSERVTSLLNDIFEC